MHHFLLQVSAALLCHPIKIQGRPPTMNLLPTNQNNEFHHKLGRYHLCSLEQWKPHRCMEKLGIGMFLAFVTWNGRTERSLHVAPSNQEPKQQLNSCVNCNFQNNKFQFWIAILLRLHVWQRMTSQPDFLMVHLIVDFLESQGIITFLVVDV